MIETKLFEVRDRATFIPVIASRMWPELLGVPSLAVSDMAAKFLGEPGRIYARECYLLRRCGFPAHPENRLVWLSKIYSHPEKATYSPYEHDGGPRTMPIAHRYITDHWKELRSGDVIDVEWILGETEAPKPSEQDEHPYPPEMP